MSVPPTPAATYERARRLANLSLWTINLQYQRLRSDRSELGGFLGQKWSDFDFLIVALTRLRRAAVLARSVPQIRTRIANGIAEFDRALPHLKKLRDVSEHFDDYAVDEGWDQSVRRQELEVSAVLRRGPTLDWLGHRLNAEDAMKASENLLQVILEAAEAFEPDA